MRKIKKVAVGTSAAAIAVAGGVSAVMVACAPNKPIENKPEERKQTTPEDQTPSQQSNSKKLDESKEGGQDQKQQPNIDSQNNNQKQEESKKEEKEQPKETKKDTPLINLTPAIELATYYLPLVVENKPAEIELIYFTSSVDLVLNWGNQDLGTEDKWNIEVELQDEEQGTIIKNKPLLFTKQKNNKNEQTLKLTFGTMEDKKKYTVKSVKLISQSAPTQTVELKQNIISKDKNTIEFLFKDQENKKVKEEDLSKHLVKVLYNSKNPLILKSNNKNNIEVEFKLDGSGTTDLDNNLALLRIGYQTQDGLKQVQPNPSNKVITIKQGKANIELNQNDVDLIINQNLTHIWLIVSPIYSPGFSPHHKYRLNYENPEFVSDYNREVPLVYIKVPVSITKTK